jgi:hypothetical protein
MTLNDILRNEGGRRGPTVTAAQRAALRLPDGRRFIALSRRRDYLAGSPVRRPPG